MSKLSNRIVLAITLLTILVSFAMGYVIIDRAFDIVEKESRQKLIEMAHRIGSEFDYEVREVENIREQVNNLVETTFDLAALRTDPNYMDKYKDQIAPIIERMASNAKVSRSVYVFFDPALDGKTNDVWYADLHGTGRVFRQEEFDMSFYENPSPEKDWYFKAKELKRPYWTDPYRGNASFDSHLIYISHTAPIYVDNKFIGVAGADFYFDELRNRIRNISLYETGYAVLFNDEMEALIHPTLEEGVSLKDINKGEYIWLAEKMEAGEPVIEYTWVDGTQKIVASTRLLNDWIIAVAPSKEEVFRSVENMRKMIWVVALLGGFIAALVGLVIGRKLVKPIEQIVLDINKIGLGDYDNSIKEVYRKRRDEIGILANSVEKMRVTQQKSFNEINDQKLKLEKRVEERTQELIKTNEYLEESMAKLEENQAELILTNEALEDALEVTRMTQKQLIESEKIASLGYLVGGIAHEINTPVGNSVTLITYMQRESKSISQKLETGQIKKKDLSDFVNSTLEASDNIYKNLRMTSDLVNRFKQLAASESIESVIHFNVHEYLSLIVKSMGIAQETGSIQVDIEGDKNLEIHTDAGKFSQIFTNLISNSLQHGFTSSKGGSIRISYENVGDDLFIKYEDDGRGIEKDYLDSIYTPFFTTKFSGETKGLGLNIVYNVVTKLFNGSIRCDSEVGRGTIFFIKLNIE
ncbi:ATP-binding protein [Fusibacter sp. JL216-2]|uniref:ATP-binding protein n=1 Tax=Fusibacter sp. JL216-2 TaxID=3071453 RepID=UPI003D325F28